MVLALSDDSAGANGFLCRFVCMITPAAIFAAGVISFRERSGSPQACRRNGACLHSGPAVRDRYLRSGSAGCAQTVLRSPVKWFRQPAVSATCQQCRWTLRIPSKVPGRSLCCGCLSVSPTFVCLRSAVGRSAQLDPMCRGRGAEPVFRGVLFPAGRYSISHVAPERSSSSTE